VPPNIEGKASAQSLALLAVLIAFRETPMAKDQALSDLVLKIAYLSLGASAIVFVAMLWLAGVHF